VIQSTRFREAVDLPFVDDTVVGETAVHSIAQDLPFGAHVVVAQVAL
jgi:hypothetical protein